MELIAFACQRCRQPLSLPTLSDIDDMAKFIPATETQSKQPFDCNVEIADSSRPSRQTPVVRKHIHPCVDSTGIVSEDKSYVIVSQDDKQHTVNVPKDKEFVSRVQRASKLFDAISSGGTYDHPLCQECGDYFCDTLESQISELKTEKELYEEILLQSQEDSSNSITSGELDELNAEISTASSSFIRLFMNSFNQLSLEESKLIGKVKEMQKKREDLERELHELEVECRQLAEEEDR